MRKRKYRRTWEIESLEPTGKDGEKKCFAVNAYWSVARALDASMRQTKAWAKGEGEGPPNDVCIGRYTHQARENIFDLPFWLGFFTSQYARRSQISV